MSDIIFLDLETSGLPIAGAADPRFQPHIIELCMINGAGEMLHQLIRPPVKLTEEVTKITGITNEMVNGQRTFAQMFGEVAYFCLGVDTWVAHNLPFDKMIMQIEIERLGKTLNFPWPISDYCTLEQVQGLVPNVRDTKNLKLGTLYEYVTGKKLSGAHRADVDTLAVRDIYAWIEEQYA